MLNFNNEEWKSVKGYEGIYKVSNYGRVKNNRNKILKTYTINSGYECIKFTVNGIRKSFLIHRLVLETFKPNDDMYKKEVNHIDENKHNNCLSNLEWVTSKENKQHGFENELYKGCHVFCFNKNKELVADYLKNIKSSLGKKHLPNTLSKYHNVSYDKNRNKWIAAIRVNNKNMMQKRFNTEEEAALHVNYIIDTLKLTDRPKNIIE